jgi:hypothetical protein
VVRTAAGGARRGVDRRVRLRGGGVSYSIFEQLVRQPVVLMLMRARFPAPSGSRGGL